MKLIHKRGKRNDMNFKKIFRAFSVSTLFVALCLIAGCSKTDESSDINMKFNNFSFLKEEINGYSFKKHETLDFICDIPTVNAEHVYKYSTKNTSSDNTEYEKQKLKKCMDMIFGLDIPFDKIRDFQSKDANGDLTSPVPRYDDEENGYAGEVYTSSSSFLFRHFDPKFDNIDTFFPDDERYGVNDHPKNEYQMLDGSTLTVDRAIEQAGKFIAFLENEKMFDENETQELSDIKIGNTDKGKVIILHYRHSKEGLELDEGGIILLGQNDGEAIMRNPFFEIAFSGDDSVFYIKNLYSDQLIRTEEITDIMPLSKAEKTVSESLAPNTSFSVYEVGLRYCCIFGVKDMEREYRPMWCFTLSDRHKGINGNTMQFFPRITAYVDALNGDVYYCDSQQGIFEKQDN